MIRRTEFVASGPPLNYQTVAMAEGLEWVLRPVERGWCKYESLIDGTLDISDIALMNDALDVLEENRARAHEAAGKTT